MIDDLMAEIVALKKRMRALEAQEVINPCARVYSSAGQTVPTGTGAWTAIACDGEVYDTHGMHSNVTNNTRLTAVVAGRYQIGCTVEWAFSATGYRWLAIRANGATILSPVQHAGAAQSMVTCVDYPLAAGQYVEAVVMQNSGGDLKLETVVAGPPRFWMHKIG